MSKRAASAQGETTPNFEILGSKHPKRSSLNDEVRRSPTLVALDSSEQTSDALPALEGATQGVHREACELLEDGILVGGPPSTDNVVGEAPSAETAMRSLL